MARKNFDMRWTLIRHSAWTVAHDPCFERAVELEMLDNARMVARVASAGGIIMTASDDLYGREETENYPADVSGLIPRCRGTFKVVGDLDVYIPRR